MLRHIPFYGSLMQNKLSNGKKPSSSHVLVYGAIEAHSMGEKGCIASNKTIGTEIGLSQGRVANIISELNSEGWVKVNVVNGNRVNIEPLLTITTPSLTRDTLHADVNPPSQICEPPLHADVNIEHNIEHSENTAITKVIGLEPKIYGNPEINEMFNYWNEKLGYEITAKRQANRNACKNLIKKHGLEKLTKLIDGVAMAQTDQYAPRISDFTSLQSKLNDLMVWGKQKNNSLTSKGVKL